MSENQGSCGCGCACEEEIVLLYPCSGAADVGALADRAARKLTEEEVGDMSCLAGIGGRVSGMLANAEAATRIVVIDGCPLDCAKKTLEGAGIKKFDQYRVTDLGLKKGKAAVNDENIEKVAAKARELLGK